MNGLTNEQLDRFDRDGYLVVEDVLPAGDLAALEAEYSAILDRVLPALAAQGRLQSPAETTFGKRYVEALRQLDDMYELYQHLDISLPLLHPLPPKATMHTGEAVFRLLTHPDLLDVVESVIGPEIYSNPVQHARIKPPRRALPAGATDANVAATMWHQDAAVVEPEADATDMLTVWVAVTDATIANGCLTVVPGSHRERTGLHCPGKVFPGEIYIPDALIDRARVVPLEVGAGGVVLLHRRTQHGSLANETDEIRWSFDLRYQPIGQPTGRAVFPGFVARSAVRPVLDDGAAWAQLWWDARDRIAAGRAELRIGGRWDGNAARPVCA